MKYFVLINLLLQSEIIDLYWENYKKIFGFELYWNMVLSRQNYLEPNLEISMRSLPLELKDPHWRGRGRTIGARGVEDQQNQQTRDSQELRDWSGNQGVYMGLR